MGERGGPEGRSPLGVAAGAGGEVMGACNRHGSGYRGQDNPEVDIQGLARCGRRRGQD